MRTVPLHMLTWGTITAAVSSAVWLSSTDQSPMFCSVSYGATSRALGIDIPLPAEPTRAGRSSITPRSSASSQLPASSS